MNPPGSGVERYIQLEQEPPSGGLRDFLTILFKHRTKVWVIFLATVLTVTIGSFLIPPTYEAKSSLMVKMGREYVNRPEVGDTRSLMSLNQEEVVNSEIPILTSRELIEKVLTAMKVETVYPDLAKDPPSNMTPLQAAILAFEKKLTVEGVKKSNVIEVAFQHKDPQVAARAVNLLVDDYKAKHLQVFSDPQSSFLEQQLADYEQKLKESESRMEAYKQKHRVFSLEEQRTLLLKQRMELDTSLKTTRNQVDELQKKLSSLKSQQKARTEDPSNYTLSERDKIIVEARSRLLSLQLKEQDLLKQYTESNRLVLNTRKEIQLVQVFLKEQETEISGKVRTGNPVYQEVEKETIKTQAELSSQIAKAAALTRQLGNLENEIRSFDLLDNEFQTLKREVASNEKNYRTYLERLEEARISEDMNRKKMANISVIQPAAVPAKPIKPKKALNILLGMILGAVSGLGFAFFSEYTSESFSTPEIAERQLALPVLTTIPHRD
jgi:uncharacterized protein involved in exopolysaccharide biosynthesis